MDLQTAQHYCRVWARNQYENFTVVSFLLPRRFRQDFYNIYAFCRWSDNLADEISDKSQSLRLLQWWGDELKLCFEGSPQHPIMIALQSTIQRRGLSIEPFQDLLSAFVQDQSVDRYRNDDHLEDYCRRSANPVGRILLSLADSASPECCALSDHICTGLQLANFCQDMRRDAAMGRIYAPQSRWQAYGVSEDMLLAGQPTGPLRALLSSWVSSIRSRFHQGWKLVELVPRWLAVDIDLFVRGGLATLDQIAKVDYDVWSKRPTVSTWCKGKLLAQAILSRSRKTRGLPMH